MSMSDSIYRHIIAITNRLLSRRPFDVQIERICRLHPHALILREKDLSGEAYQTLAEKVLTLYSASVYAGGTKSGGPENSSAAPTAGGRACKIKIWRVRAGWSVRSFC